MRRHPTGGRALRLTCVAPAIALCQLGLGSAGGGTQSAPAHLLKQLLLSGPVAWLISTFPVYIDRCFCLNALVRIFSTTLNRGGELSWNIKDYLSCGFVVGAFFKLRKFPPIPSFVLFFCDFIPSLPP